MGNKISEKMKDKRVVVAICVGVIFLISLLYYGNVSKSTNIYGGVRVGDIDLSKLSKQEAYEKLSKQKTEDLKIKICLSC